MKTSRFKYTVMRTSALPIHGQEGKKKRQVQKHHTLLTAKKREVAYTDQVPEAGSHLRQAGNVRASFERTGTQERGTHCQVRGGVDRSGA